MTLGARLPQNPLIRPQDVTPSLPGLEVVAAFNAATARVGDDYVLLLRVAERPRGDPSPDGDPVMLDLSGPEPSTRPLPPGLGPQDLVGMAFLDTRKRPPEMAVGYLPRDLAGLDLSDPRTIRFASPHSAAGITFGYADYLAEVSHLRVARSRDGIHFTVDERPAIAPETVFEEYGIEDARATLIDGTWEITYVSVSHLGITTSRASTKDFRSFERHGLVMLPDHKDVVLFPERIGGRYFALTRPMPQSFGRVLGIWIAYSDDLCAWGGHRPLALPRWGRWDELRTGAGAVPFRTPQGWLELYHGVDRRSRYAMGALLLDVRDPSRVLARSPEPILVPEAPYELEGLVPDVVFSCGVVPLDGGERVRLYYGGADSVVAAADFEVSAILDHLEPLPAGEAAPEVRDGTWPGGSA